MSRDFQKLKTAVNEQLKKMEEKYNDLFVVNVDNTKIWELYLDSFPKKENPIFRERRVYDCNCCKHFFRNIGNVIGINENNQIVSIWDIETGDEIFDKVCQKLSKEIKKYPISRLFKTELEMFGSEDNFDNYLQDVKWEHFMYKVPAKYLLSYGTKTSFIAETNTIRRLFGETMETLNINSLNTVKELIKTNSLYKGSEYLYIIDELLIQKELYDKVPEEEKNNYIWKISPNIRREVGGVKNTAIGTLILDINEGVDLETAVRKYEAVVAPENYKRSKPIYTQAMLDEAKKKISELGYLDSLDRRYANIDDVSVENVLFVNRNIKNNAFSDDIFGVLSENVTVNAKKIKNAEEIEVKEFLENVLPNAKEISVLVENKHAKNFMTLTTAQNIDSKSMFKWDNNFAWNYIGGITDSRMKEEVAKKGGSVTGDLRFSIMWNDENKNLSDLDAHCIEKTEKGKFKIYFQDKKSRLSKGELDVDIINPSGIAVENITFSDRNKMPNGTYTFLADYYNKRNGSENGFKAEIEFDNEIFEYSFSGHAQNGKVNIAEVKLENGNFTIKHLLKENASSISSQKIWGVNTNQFTPVKMVTKSPNAWNGNTVGNEHLFFFLDGCVSEEKPTGVFNEFLKDELYRNHRKVFEAIGGLMNVEETENQLSGVGFSLTRKNNLIVKVNNKVYNIKF